MMRLVSDRDGPMCPNGIADPPNLQHMERSRSLNRLYEASPRDEETLESTPELEAAYRAVEGAGDYMLLYSVEGYDPTARRSVSAYFWRCTICGLILQGQGNPK